MLAAKAIIRPPSPSEVALALVIVLRPIKVNSALRTNGFFPERSPPIRRSPPPSAPCALTTELPNRPTLYPNRRISPAIESLLLAETTALSVSRVVSLACSSIWPPAPSACTSPEEVTFSPTATIEPAAPSALETESEPVFTTSPPAPRVNEPSSCTTTLFAWPSWLTACEKISSLTLPVSSICPPLASIRPLLITAASTPRSLSRVSWLTRTPINPLWSKVNTASLPAARFTRPKRAAISPWFSTRLPTRLTLPPKAAFISPWLTTVPSLPLMPSRANSPLIKSSVRIFNPEASSPPTFTDAPSPKIIPWGLIKKTWPLASI